MSLFEQMGNIGGEISRALAARARGDELLEAGALDRALELFDLTAADPRLRTRLREIMRAREVVCDYFFGDNEYGSTAESLDSYFLQFAMAARLSR